MAEPKVYIYCRRHGLDGDYPVSQERRHNREHDQEEAERREQDLRRKEAAAAKRAVRDQNAARQAKKNNERAALEAKRTGSTSKNKGAQKQPTLPNWKLVRSSSNIAYHFLQNNL